jgi:hypothetical protein
MLSNGQIFSIGELTHKLMGGGSIRVSFATRLY